jgi:hypothetical protein
MKKMFITATLFSLILLLSCKKDTPSFSATGYWKGNLFYYTSALLNRPDGTTRMYAKIPGPGSTDTASAEFKYDGTFTVSENVYRAVIFQGGPDSLILESTSTSAKTMSGRAFTDYNGEFLPFEFNKQP